MGSLSNFNLASIRVFHKLRSLVETGTATGDGVEHALRAGFETIHSIEIMPDLAQAARLRFKAAPHVQIWEGDSRKCLPMILKELPPEPALFWLDAHFPNAHGTGGTYTDEPDKGRRMPLEEEVRAIRAARPTAKDVLLIDDTRIYVPGPYEMGDAPDDLLLALDGIERGPHGLDFVRDLYGDTHGCIIDHRHHGYMMVFPRMLSIKMKAAQCAS